jgi:hypothetical protein
MAVINLKEYKNQKKKERIEEAWANTKRVIDKLPTDREGLLEKKVEYLLETVELLEKELMFQEAVLEKIVALVLKK